MVKFCSKHFVMFLYLLTYAENRMIRKIFMIAHFPNESKILNVIPTEKLKDLRAEKERIVLPCTSALKHQNKNNSNVILFWFSDNLCFLS